MALSKVMTIVNDSGSGGSTVRPATGPSTAKLQQVASNVARMNASSGGGGSTNTATTQQVSSGGGGGGGFDLNSYLNSLRSAADAVYNRARTSLDSTLKTTLGGLLESYEDNESALRQAYINKMINARDMAQLLTAQGLTGGASETTTANMLNNYANNRNALNRTYATNLRDLLTNHEGLLADALGAYNDKVANARQSHSNYLAQLEQNRANMIASAMPSFSNLLSLLG